MSSGVEMPRYKCHKEVWALKISAVDKHPIPTGPQPDCESSVDYTATLSFEDDGYAPLEVTRDYMRKHNPQVGGYYVVYKDGYKSFSPAEAFEDGYTRI